MAIYQKKEFNLSNRSLRYTNKVIYDCKNDVDLLILKFKNKQKYELKTTHIEFMKYINDMIDFDLLNGVNISDDKSVKAFSPSDVENDLIYFTDLISIGGKLMLDAFDENLTFKMTYRVSNPISTAALATTCIDNLKRIKILYNKKDLFAKNVAFGTNCVLCSLIEHELKLLVKTRYIVEVLGNAKILVDSGSLTLDAQNLDYFNDMYSAYILGAFCSRNDLKASGVDFYNFITTYSSLNLNYGIEKKLFKESISLNQIIGNNGLTNNWEPEFKKIVANIFGTGKLNLRNNLAHLGCAMHDYHSVYSTFLLYEILFCIMKNFYQI